MLTHVLINIRSRYYLLVKLVLITTVIHFVFSTTTYAIEDYKDLAKINNYRQYNENFASSGQPTKEQLKLVKNSGVERVIYLAFNNNTSALKDEDRLVTSLGMTYIHIPVDFDNPSLSDFQIFSTIMKQNQQKTLLHCQVNFRASTFSFLYRVLSLNEPIHEAKEALDSVWEPNEIWFQYIRNTLAHYSVDYDCDKCDWGAYELMY